MTTWWHERGRCVGIVTDHGGHIRANVGPEQQGYIAPPRPFSSSAGRGPCAAGVQHADPGTTRPGTTSGFKAPVERSTSTPTPAAQRGQLGLL